MQPKQINSAIAERFSAIRRKEFNRCAKFAKGRLFGVQEQNSELLSSYIVVNLESSNSNAVKTHIGINDVLNGSNVPKIDSFDAFLI